MDRKTPSDHLHLIGYYRKVLEPRLGCKILFSNDVPKTINGWMEKAIQFNTNWRMGSLFFNQDIKASPLKQKADTNKSNKNAFWWRTSERKDPNAMDVDALTMEETGMLLRQGKCFRCRRTGHMAKECPPEQGESSKQKKVVMTLISNEYRQSSKSSVLMFKFEVLRQLRMPIARYCLSVELV
jgi:Zinc knuckle